MDRLPAHQGAEGFSFSSPSTVSKQLLYVASFARSVASSERSVMLCRRRVRKSASPSSRTIVKT